MPETYSARVIGASELGLEGSLVYPDQFRLRFLAEGDSWFSLSQMPIYLAADNLLNHLKFRESALIVQTAYPGDLIQRIADWSRNPQFRRLIRFGYGPGVDAILLSGGGNDLIAAAAQIIKPYSVGSPTFDATAAIDDAEFAKLESYVVESFRTIAEWRDAANSSVRGKPVFLHTYDFAVPRNAPARVMLGTSGPWLWTTMTQRGYPDETLMPLAFHLVQRLANVLLSLDDDPANASPNRLPGFHVANTLGTVQPADPQSPGESGDWINEIHPSTDGYRKLGARFSAHIERVLFGP